MNNPAKGIPKIFYDATLVKQSIGQCDCSDCDCACAETTTIFSAPPDLYTRETHKLYRTPDSVIRQLNDEYKVYFSPYHFTSILNLPAENLLAEWGRETSGTQNAHEVIESFVNARLLSPVPNLTSFLGAVTKTLTTWVHITDGCNLRCDYCYLPHQSRSMSTSTGYKIVDATLRSALLHGYQHVKFKYGGGEALLKMSLVHDIHCYAKKQAQRLGVDIEGVVLSNGTLVNNEILSQLKESELRLMISLDGIGSAHDVQRYYKNGAGSYEHVVRGILRSITYGIRPDISITVSGKNADYLPEVISWVIDNDLRFSINFYRENNYSKSITDLKLDQKIIIKNLLLAYKVIESKLPEHSLLGSLADRANLSIPHSKTCGVGDHYIVYDCDGRVAKCQMELDKPITDDCPNDPLLIIVADESSVQNISVEGKKGCNNCQWKYWCAGGCPIITKRVTGRFDVQSPHCEIYQVIFPEIIRLEGLRLLKNFC